jgi:hypothetical protein
LSMSWVVLLVFYANIVFHVVSLPTARWVTNSWIIGNSTYTKQNGRRSHG